MKYIKNHTQFVINKGVLDKNDIKKNYKNSAIVNEVLDTGSLTWGGSLIGRLFSSIGRLLRIEYNKYQIKNLIGQLEGALQSLCIESKLDDPKEIQMIRSAKMFYILREIRKVCRSKKLTEEDKIKSLVGEGKKEQGLIIRTIEWINTNLDEKIFPNKKELIKKLEDFRLEILKLLKKPSTGSNDSRELVNNMVTFTRSAYNILKNYTLIDLEAKAKPGATSSPSTNVQIKKGDKCICLDPSNPNLYMSRVIVISPNGADAFNVKKATWNQNQKNYVAVGSIEKVESKFLHLTNTNKFKNYFASLKKNPNATAQQKQQLWAAAVESNKLTFDSWLTLNEDIKIKEGDTPDRYHIWQKVVAKLNDLKKMQNFQAIFDLMRNLYTDPKKYSKELKILSGVVVKWYNDNKGEILNHDTLIKEQNSSDNTPYGQVDKDILKVGAILREMMKVIMGIDYKRGIEQGPNFIDFSDKNDPTNKKWPTANDDIQNFQRSFKAMSGILRKYPDDSEKRNLIQESKNSKLILEANNSLKEVKEIWGDFFEKDKKLWSISEDELQEFIENSQGKVEEVEEIKLDKDRLVRVIRIFQWAHDLYYTDYIPSNRPGGVVSPSVLREYRKIGGGEISMSRSEGSAVSPPSGPFINISTFKKWEEGVMDMIEKPENLKLFKSLIVKRVEGSEDSGERFGEEKASAYKKTTLFKFVVDMITISDKPDYEKQRREILAKYVLGDLDLPKSNPTSKGDGPNSEPVPDDEKDVLTFSPLVKFGSKWSADGKTWKDLVTKYEEHCYLWGVEYRPTSGNPSQEFWCAYIIGADTSGKFLTLRFDRGKNKESVGKLIYDLFSKELTNKTLKPGSIKNTAGGQFYGVIELSETIKIGDSNNPMKIKISSLDGSKKGEGTFYIKKDPFMILTNCSKGTDTQDPYGKNPPSTFKDADKILQIFK